MDLWRLETQTDGCSELRVTELFADTVNQRNPFPRDFKPRHPELPETREPYLFALIMTYLKQIRYISNEALHHFNHKIRKIASNIENKNTFKLITRYRVISRKHLSIDVSFHQLLYVAVNPFEIKRPA